MAAILCTRPIDRMRPPARPEKVFPPARRSRQNVRNDHRPGTPRTMSQIRIHPQSPRIYTVIPEPRNSVIERRRLLHFGGNGHAAVRLSKAREALARRPGGPELFDVPYPGFEGRPDASSLGD